MANWTALVENEKEEMDTQVNTAKGHADTARAQAQLASNYVTALQDGSVTANRAAAVYKDGKKMFAEPSTTSTVPLPESGFYLILLVDPKTWSGQGRDVVSTATVYWDKGRTAATAPMVLLGYTHATDLTWYNVQVSADGVLTLWRRRTDLVDGDVVSSDYVILYTRIG